MQDRLTVGVTIFLLILGLLVLPSCTKSEHYTISPQALPRLSDVHESDERPEFVANCPQGVAIVDIHQACHRIRITGADQLRLMIPRAPISRLTPFDFAIENGKIIIPEQHSSSTFIDLKAVEAVRVEKSRLARARTTAALFPVVLIVLSGW